jgi:acyl carrier protein
MTGDTPVKTLADLLSEIRPEFDFVASRDFLADGMLDSFDMIALVAALDETYDISIDGVDILPEHFQNLDTIAALLRKYGVAP